MKLYLAGPFFNTVQRELIERLEATVRSVGFELFSPRLIGGVLSDMAPLERAAAVDKVFQSNVNGIDDCDVILAVVDDRDPGTIWETGYAYAKKCVCGSPVILTFTDQSYGLNVMIQKSVDGHARGIEECRVLLRRVIDGREIGPDFLRFSDKVT